MYPEYLFNNDTQDICRRVCEMATSDEPALRAHCLEVSCQADTSSLTAKEECIVKTNNAKAVFINIERILRGLSESLASKADIFRAQNGKGDFPAVCRAVTQMEEERLHLLSCITDLTQTRQTIFSAVANANRALHYLKTAKRAVPTELRAPYNEAVECTEAAYARLIEVDSTVREVQSFSMTFVERHLPTLMERLRAAADFNHAGEMLDAGAIRSLCNEIFILINRAPNVF